MRVGLVSEHGSHSRDSCREALPGLRGKFGCLNPSPQLKGAVVCPEHELSSQEGLNRALPARNRSISFFSPWKSHSTRKCLCGSKCHWRKLISPGQDWNIAVNIWISLNFWLMMLLCPISFAVNLLHRFPNHLSLPCRHTEDPTSDSRGNFLVVCLGEGKLLSCVFTAAARKGHLEVSMTAPSHCWSHRLRLGTL